MNFSENIQAKANELIHKANVITGVDIIWEMPVAVNCENLETKEKLWESKAADVFMPYKKRPAIYYFEITSGHTGKEVVDALSKYKLKGERSCPKIEKKRPSDSKYLYCGSRKEGLHGRFIQHLGFGSDETFALQLLYWAKNIKLELKFHYAWLGPDYKDFTELIESALADKLEPLVGKKA